MRHPEILDHLLAAGLTVVETNGWRTRGNETFTPSCSVNHHTAGARAGDAPSLNLVINGRRDVAGPLCNVLQSRHTDAHGLDVVYLIAAGRANHAGTGHWEQLTGNSRAWGLEVEHVGTALEPFPGGRLETSVRVHTAFARCSRFTADEVCQHWEWATPPGRKTDFTRALVDSVQFRSLVAVHLAGNKPAPLPAVVAVPGVMEAAMRITIPIRVESHRGYADLTRGYAGLAKTVTANEVLALTYAGADPDPGPPGGADAGWKPHATAPLELVDHGGVARVVIPSHEVGAGVITVYAAVAD